MLKLILSPEILAVFSNRVVEDTPAFIFGIWSQYGQLIDSQFAMDDTASTTTSVEDNTGNLLDNPTRDTLAEGLLGLLKPTVDQLDERVRATRYPILR